jgi:hypothetical protein
MNPLEQTQLKEQVTKLKIQVAELLEWKALKEKRQLSFPLDTQSIRVLNQTMRTEKFDRLNVRDIYFTATNTSPTVAGQMRFYNDGATQNMRINTTYTVFTGTVDLTAV